MPVQVVTDSLAHGRKPVGRRFVYVLLLLVLYGLAANFALVEFIRYPGLNSAERGFFGENFYGDMIYGSAPRPYVGRVLVPWLVRGAVVVTPPAARAALARELGTTLAATPGMESFARFGYEFALTRLLLFGFLFGFALALRRLAQVTIGLTGAARDALPVVALFLLPAQYGYSSQLYDFPALCLFTWGLLSIAEGRDVLYLAAFAVAAVNKETAILLAFVWLLVRAGKIGRGRLVVGLLLQVGIWLAIRGGVAWLYHGNPGEDVAWRLGRNLAILASPATYLSFRAVGNWLVLPGGLNVVYLPFAVWALAALRNSPPFLRRACWIAVPLAVTALLFGNVDEMRVYYEFSPVLLLVLVGSLRRFLVPDVVGS